MHINRIITAIGFLKLNISALKSLKCTYSDYLVRPVDISEFNEYIEYILNILNLLCLSCQLLCDCIVPFEKKHEHFDCLASLYL